MFEKAELLRHELPIMLEPGGYGLPALYLTDVDEQVLYFSNSPLHRREDSFPIHVNVLQDLMEVLGGDIPVGIRRDVDENGDPVLVVLGWADEIDGGNRSSVETIEETARRTGFSEWLFETAFTTSRALIEQADGGH